MALNLTEENTLALVQKLAENKSEVMKPVMEIIFEESLTKNRDQIVKLMLEKKLVDASINFNHGVRWALKNDKTDLLDWFLSDSRVDVSIDDNAALNKMIEKSDLKAVEWLLENNKVAETAGSSLEQVIKLNKNDIFLIMLPKVKPLKDAAYVAFQEKQYSMAKLLLLDGKVDPVFGSAGQLIIKASEEGQSEIVQVLLNDKRVDPSCFNNHALILAAGGDHLEVMKLLLADPRVNFDKAAIEYAATKGKLQALKMLFNDPRFKKFDYSNAIKGAKREKHTEVVDFLLAMSNIDPETNKDLFAAGAYIDFANLMKKYNIKHIEIVKDRCFGIALNPESTADLQTVCNEVAELINKHKIKSIQTSGTSMKIEFE